MYHKMVLMVALAGTPSTALAFCFEPSAPSCVSGYGPFESEWEFDSCRREVVSFQAEVEDYLACLQRDLADEAERIQSEATTEIEDASREANNLADAAIDEAEQVVDDFNDRSGN